MIIANTATHLRDHVNTRPHLLSVSGGIYNLKYQRMDGAWVHVDGSPFADGSQKIIYAYSEATGGQLQGQGDTGGMEAALKQVEV